MNSQKKRGGGERKAYLFLIGEDIFHFYFELGVVYSPIAHNDQCNTRRIEFSHGLTKSLEGLEGEFLSHVGMAGYHLVHRVGRFEGERRQHHGNGESRPHEIFNFRFK